MKSTFTNLLVIVGIFSLAVSAQNPFGIRAWHRVRWPDVDTNPINHHVEVESGTGDAVINKTANYPGFNNLISPTAEEGTLRRVDNKYRGYLVPLLDVKTTPKTKSRHYQLRYSKKIPKIAGVLYTNFTSVGRDCGAMCGGYMMDYDLGGDRHFGEWYVIKENKKKNVWKLRWIGIKKLSDPLVYPKDAVPVYLWKDQL